ncbi:MAG: hypothetical protein D6707_11050 [Bacteroidetes bacterium]|nr:MAG: hypothetical protein D6707_11050 [Bacteroidota bacterium]
MSTPKSEITRQIEHEHEELKTQMEELQRTIQVDLSNETFKDWQVDTILKLRDFKSVLEKHFEMEEIGGFNEELIRLKPQNKKKIEELETEHREIILKIETIINDLKKIIAFEKEKIARIVNDVLNVIETLYLHEAAERELVSSTYYHDVGSAD